MIIDLSWAENEFIGPVGMVKGQSETRSQGPEE